MSNWSKFSTRPNVLKFPSIKQYRTADEVPDDAKPSYYLYVRTEVGRDIFEHILVGHAYAIVNKHGDHGLVLKAHQAYLGTLADGTYILVPEIIDGCLSAFEADGTPIQVRSDQVDKCHNDDASPKA